MATALALFSTLLTFSSHSFSQNLVTNPGFENGTSGWSLAENASAQYTESSGRSGDRLTHWSSSSSYTAETTQTVSGLSAGTYRLSVYTVGGSTSSASLWASCDGQNYSTPIPSSPWGSWAQVVVDGISVSGSSCQLGITTQNSEWSSFDDVVFEQVSSDDPDPTAIVIEEGTGFCSVDGTVDSNHADYNGSGFANTDNATGTGVEWRVNVPSSGTYTLEWRYASSSSRPGSVLINGSSQGTVDFPSTGAWSTWATVSTTVNLSAGDNTIRLQATGSDGLGNIDSLSVAGDSPEAANCDGGDPDPTTIVIEEGTGFCDLDGSIDNSHSGYNGAGFADTVNATGAWVEWTISVPSSGLYDLEWRYANGASASRPGDVLINGSSVATVDFPVTGAWVDWEMASANIAMSAGENTIRLQATTSGGLGNIDSMAVTGNSPQAAACEVMPPSNGSAGCGSAPGLSTGRHSISVNGLHREYEINIPSNYNANNPYRLVFDWHGRGWSAAQMAGDWAEAGSLLDLSNGTAIFVAPDRYVSPTGQDDMGWPNTNGRDMDFLRALLDRFNNELCIDQDRIFSAGFSFGGMMSLAVGREMGHVFRAIAPVSGAFWTPHTNLGLPMAIWIAHGTQDGTVGYSNGIEARDYFISANGCSNSTVPVGPGSCVEYQGCDAGHPVVWCSHDGGHAGPSYWESATWDFFSRF